MASTDTMSPGASPGGSSGASRGFGVRRVNNVPLYIVGGVVALFLVIVLWVVVDRSKTPPPAALAAKKGVSSMDVAKQVAGQGPAGGEIPAAAPTAPTIPTAPTDANGVAVAPVNPDVPPTPPGGTAGNANPPQESPAVAAARQRREALREMKLQQFTDAVKAPTNIKMAATRSPGSPPLGGSDDVAAKIADLQQKIAQAQADVADGGNSSTLAALQQTQRELAAVQGSSAGNTQRNDLGQFGNKAGGDRWQTNNQIDAPANKFELRAGFVIPGTLISGLNSELPGQIVAQVSQNVYDTATGRYLLIPQGSRLVGSYSADVSFGQSRILVAWQRIVFPDGKALDLGAMPGANSAGYGGFKDQVNNHYFRTFASALLLSGITAGATLAQPSGNSYNQYGQLTTSGALSQALGQELGEATAELLRKNMNIAPTLKVRPGFRFNVIVTKDLIFSKPYQNFDY